jgi:uncharacterized protein YndB with AHSA1/START domain
MESVFKIADTLITQLMATKNDFSTDTTDRELIVSRLVNAPRELVFKVFTDPEHVARWWGPRNFIIKVHEMDVRPGGIWRFDMDGYGQTFHEKIVYKEVVKPERLVLIHGSDVANFEKEEDAFENIITFEVQGQKTLVTMKAVFKTASYLQKVIKENYAVEGGKQTMDKLEEYLLAIGKI